MGRYLLHPFLYTYTSASLGASGAHLNPIPMARFIITTNGGQVVIDAFMRIYGIDIKKAGCLNMVELEVEQF